MARNVLMRTIKKLRRRTSGALTVLTLVGAGLLFGPEAASAQTCIQNVWQAHGKSNNLTCTAQDVTLSEAGNINISAGGQCVMENGVRVCRCFTGQDVTFTADFRMDLTADTRYDVGFYIATDGDPNEDGAITGLCSATASSNTNTPAGNFINLDAAPDVCGDITGPLGTANNPLFVTATITTECPTAGAQLVLPFCTTWRQPGSNQVCLGTGTGPASNDVFPGSPSKCNCGDLAIDIFGEDPEITVTKETTSSVPETGGSATYTVKVKNDGTIDVTLTSLTDDKYGDITTIHAADASCTGSVPAGDCQAVTATTCVADASFPNRCVVGGTIAAGAECSCSFTGTVPPGDSGGSFTDTVTACADNITNSDDDCKTDDASVPYTDVPQPPSLTKDATSSACRIDTTYNVVVTNGSAQDVLTLNTLNDDVFGNITLSAGASCTGTCIVSTTCGLGGTGNPGPLPADIAASGQYSCSFVGRVSECNRSVHDTVTGTATDDDGANYTPSDDATIVISVGPPPPPPPPL